MNNINSNNYPEKSDKSNRWNKLPYTLLLVTLLNLNNPSEAKTFDTYNFNMQNVEVLSDSSIVSNIERKTWIILPKMYADKIKNFVQNSKVVEGLGAKFTEDFIVDQMRSDRWISKQNQLLFIWDVVYEQITKKNFYDWEDWDEKRLEEFENVMDSIEDCGEKYKNWFTSYMKQKSAEARQQSAEARQQSINTINNTFEAVIDFYISYQKSPDLKRLESFKPKVERLISRCKDLWIDYKAKLSPEILKFYGVE